MFRSARRTLPALYLAPMLLLSACEPEEAELEAATPPLAAAAGALPAAAPQEVVVRTRDFVFDAPDTIQSGPTRLRLINAGPDFHHIQLVRLEDGHTLADLMRHMASNEHPPVWAVEVGGPNTPGLPGEETNATLDLKPGEYAMLCIIPAPDGQLHIMKGMVKPLTVVPAAATGAALPPADLVMVLDDYSFTEDAEIQPGLRTIRVENRAAQPHEVIFAKLEPGKTPQDLLQFIMKPEGTPPGKLVGGTTAIARGEVNHVSIQFEPGEYALLCFIPDARDGKPHIAHGMVRQITVG